MRNSDVYPLGFITPDGTDQAATNRKSTVDSWAARSSTPIPSKTFENKPMVGFKIGKTVRHSFSRSSVDRWRVIDPRGFELEISSGNMSLIIDMCIVDNGEIIDACVWAREGKDNVLLPVSCDEYKSAVINTERKNKNVSVKEVEPGDYVTLQNGIKGRFLGKHYRVYHAFTYLSGEQTPVAFKQSSGKVFWMEVDGKIEYFSSIKISTIDKKAALSEVEAEKYINEKLKVHKDYRSYSDDDVFVTNKPFKSSQISHSIMDFNNTNDVIESDFKYVSMILNDKMYLIDKKYLKQVTDPANAVGYYSKSSAQQIDIDNYNSGVFEFYTTTVQSRYTYYGSKIAFKTIDISAAECIHAKYKGMKYTITTAVGNVIEFNF